MKKLYVRSECNVNDSEIDMFYITGDRLKNDKDVSDELNISIEKYWSILKKYGAVDIDTYEPMFKTYEEAQNCIDYLNKGTYIEDTKCLCEKDDDAYMFIAQRSDGEYELQFWGHEYYDDDGYSDCDFVCQNSIVIKYCPYCGRKLK